MKYAFKREHSYAEWIEKLSACGWKCFWCEAPLTEVTATKDHMQPTSRGGTDKIFNVVPACLKCNAKKGNRNAVEFRTYLQGACAKKRTGIPLLTPKPVSQDREEHRALCAAAARDDAEAELTSWAWIHPSYHP